MPSRTPSHSHHPTLPAAPSPSHLLIPPFLFAPGVRHLPRRVPLSRSEATHLFHPRISIHSSARSTLIHTLQFTTPKHARCWPPTTSSSNQPIRRIPPFTPIHTPIHTPTHKPHAHAHLHEHSHPMHLHPIHARCWARTTSNSAPPTRSSRTRSSSSCRSGRRLGIGFEPGPGGLAGSGGKPETLTVDVVA